MYSLFLPAARLAANLSQNFSFSNGVMVQMPLLGRAWRLVAQAELGDERAVALNVGALEVLEETAALADKHQQAAP
jgi:hypothetical protein